MADKKFDQLRLSNQVCFPLYAASREIIKKYRPYLDPLDITYTQYVTMLVIWEEKKVTVKDLGAKLCLDSGTLTPVLKNLEAKGFVSRNRSTEDERVLIVTLTKAGEALRDKVKDVPAAIRKELPLDENELKTLNTLVAKLIPEADD